MENFKELLAAYLLELTHKHNSRTAQEFPQLAAMALERTGSAAYEMFEATTGKRYARITRRMFHDAPGRGSAHCFVEIATGHIYKPAGYSAPAKGIRGNIAKEKKPIFCGDFYAG